MALPSSTRGVENGSMARWCSGSENDTLDRWRAVVALVAAIAATAGAVGLFSGSIDFGRSIDTRLPFASKPLAGAALLVLVALPTGAASLLSWRRSPAGASASLLAGLILVAWIVLEMVVIRAFSWLQPVMVLFGVGLTLGAKPNAWSRSNPRFARRRCRH